MDLKFFSKISKRISRFFRKSFFEAKTNVP